MPEYCKECGKLYLFYRPNQRLEAVNICKDCLAKRYKGISWLDDIIVIPYDEAIKNFVWVKCHLCEAIMSVMDGLKDRFDVGVSTQTGDLLFIHPKDIRPKD